MHVPNLKPKALLKAIQQELDLGTNSWPNKARANKAGGRSYQTWFCGGIPSNHFIIGYKKYKYQCRNDKNGGIKCLTLKSSKKNKNFACP